MFYIRSLADRSSQILAHDPTILGGELTANEYVVNAAGCEYRLLKSGIILNLIQIKDYHIGVGTYIQPPLIG